MDNNRILNHQNITLNSDNSISAYVHYEPQKRSIQKSTGMFEGSSLIITFNESEVVQREDVRLATGEDINWWACVSDEIPREKFVICQDGVYIWKEIREWDGEDFEVVDMKFELVSSNL